MLHTFFFFPLLFIIFFWQFNSYKENRLDIKCAAGWDGRRRTNQLMHKVGRLHNPFGLLGLHWLSILCTFTKLRCRYLNIYWHTDLQYLHLAAMEFETTGITDRLVCKNRWGDGKGSIEVALCVMVYCCWVTKHSPRVACRKLLHSNAGSTARTRFLFPTDSFILDCINMVAQLYPLL